MARHGHPAPEFRMHKTISQGEFAPGAEIIQESTITTLVPLTSSVKARVRFKATAGGILYGTFLRPGVIPGEFATFANEEYCDTGNPDSVAVTADVEALMEVELAGEAWLLLEFIEGDVGDGVVVYCNVAQL